MRRACVAAGLAAAAALAGCAGGGGGGAAGEVGRVDARALPGGSKYAVYVPAGDPPRGGWPCIVFLNGRGECGTDGRKQLSVGLMPAVRTHPERWPFVIVFPQKPDQESLWSAHREMVLETLAETRARERVDASRVYLTGLSQGGAGTWGIAAGAPGVFAALAPVCGWGESDTVLRGIGGAGVWAFHGGADDVVPPEATRRAVAVVSALRGEVIQEVERDDGTAAPLRLTVYPGVNHNSWDRAYGESGVWAWLPRFGGEKSKGD